MHELTTPAVIERELDQAISINGVTVFFNHLYGTCHEVDKTHVFALERARRMLSGSNAAVDYIRNLLTIRS